MEYFGKTKEYAKLSRVIPAKELLERWRVNESRLADIVELDCMAVFFVEEKRLTLADNIYICRGPFHGTPLRPLYSDGYYLFIGDIVGKAENAVFNLDEVERIEKKRPELLLPLGAPFQKTHSALPATSSEKPVAEPMAPAGEQAVLSARREPEAIMTTINVFISYAWKDHDRHYIGRLAQWLGEQEGIKVISDHLFPDGTYPEDGWPIWMEKSIKEADIVLCICGENYKKAFEGEGGGRGSRWEGAIITNDLYERFRKNKKYSVVLPRVDAHELVPSALKEWDSNILLTDWDLIHRHIKAQYKLQQTGEAQVSQNNTSALEKDTEKKQIIQQQHYHFGNVSDSQIQINSSGATQAVGGNELQSKRSALQPQGNTSADVSILVESRREAKLYRATKSNHSYLLLEVMVVNEGDGIIVIREIEASMGNEKGRMLHKKLPAPIPATHKGKSAGYSLGITENLIPLSITANTSKDAWLSFEFPNKNIEIGNVTLRVVTSKGEKNIPLIAEVVG